MSIERYVNFVLLVIHENEKDRLLTFSIRNFTATFFAEAISMNGKTIPYGSETLSIFHVKYCLPIVSMKTISNIHKEDFTLTNDLVFDSKIYISNYTFNRKK